jgi:nitroreductase
MNNIIKRLFPPGVIIILKRIRDNFDFLILKIANRSRFLCSLYYFLFSSAFRREQYGVLFGRLKYHEESLSKQNTQYLLRRNIHGLEKGILMRPRREIFGLDYIEETVNSYKNAVLNEDISNPLELQWSHDVLSEYFRVVGRHPIVENARSRFVSIRYGVEIDSLRIPYKRDSTFSTSITYEQLLELARIRKSIRWYLQKPVPRDIIDQAIILASFSPSACNRQPYEFRIFDDPELIQKISSLPGGTKGFHHNLPVIVVMVGKLRAYFSERDRHLIYIDASLASMAFMLALETLGLSSCPLNWPDVDRAENQIIKYLNLDPDERVIMLIALGYPDPDGMVAYSQKKDLNLLRKYNE